MSRTLLIAVLAALFAAPAAQAAEPLTLEQALQRADEASAMLAEQRLTLEAAEAGWLADPRAGSPSLRLGVRDLSLTPAQPGANDNMDVVARLRFPLPRPWDLHTARLQGDATAARERAQLTDMQADLHLAVRTRFELLPLLREAAGTAERLTGIWRSHGELVTQRRAEGLSTALDWLESEEERRDADDDRAVRVSELAATEAELRTLIGWPANEPLELAAVELVARAEAPLPTPEELLDGLLDRDPAVAEADADVARSEAQLQRERLRSLPWLDWLQGGLVSEPIQQQTSFEIGVAVDIPIYQWSPARTREAAQDVEASRVRADDVRARVGESVVRRLRSATATRERWLVERRHRDTLVEQSAPLLELADPLLKIELEARLARAELRVQLALADLILDLDQLEAAAVR
jgi:outer membrane protein TolC